MKKSLFIITLFILFKPLLPFVEYVVDYEYIATVLCVNKEKPELKCNGKCHLMKELAKASEDEKPLSDKKNSFKEIEILFFEEIPTISFSNPIIFHTIAVNARYTDLYTYLNSSAFFHPPTSLV